MIATTSGSLNSMYPALIIALSNSAPYFKSLNVNSATRLLQLFTSFANPTFLLADALGDIQGSDDGLFTNDTRVLSRFELEIAGRRPSLLGAAINRDNTLFTTHLTNRPLAALGEGAIPQGVIHIERTRFLWAGGLYERLQFTNFSGYDTQLPLKLTFAADFSDIFEVQGQVRKARGEMLAPLVSERGVELSYRGLDAQLRTMKIEFSLQPQAISQHQAEFLIELRQGGVAEMYIDIGAPETGTPSRERSTAGCRFSAGCFMTISRSGARRPAPICSPSSRLSSAANSPGCRAWPQSIAW